MNVNTPTAVPMVFYIPSSNAVYGVSLDIENYCTLRLFFVLPAVVRPIDHVDRQL